MATAVEEQRNTALLESRSLPRKSEDYDTDSRRETREREMASMVNWPLLFGFAGFFWLIGIAIDFVIPFATFIMNFFIVFFIWLWSKGEHLKPPRFSSGAKKISGLAARGAQKGVGQAIEKIEEAIPGSDFIYIVLGGGITPLAYVFALWLNNR